MVQPKDRPAGAVALNEEWNLVDRAAKRELVATLHDMLKDTGVIVVARNNGLVAAQSADFRSRIKAAGGTVKVAKNKLASLALDGTDAAGIRGLLTGPIILAYSKDPVAAAKTSIAYAKENDKLVILGGAMGKTVLDANGVKALAELPSLDELRATLLGLIQAPASKLVRTLNEPGSALARLIKARIDKEGGEQAA
jgi:large subunit ribosomal protein L10